ncbi:hypothetical protein [Chondromyces apiculatus]|uniref:4-vinyl reductase 4VR domain-containing protein n=1 Tax=Chondromyces apiculatus DSM 436 TaxID=1192034 RepID=A0A017TD37_9BACT|nr:hypothetical protein [Chondromyces apiculatus]EYF07198.1 Hypothetical protein CAP_0677 [Chondromyces apiculatus DSM 436]
MTSLGALARELRPRGLLGLGDQLVLALSHHHTLFLEQTLVDALGGESLALRRQAAFEAAHAILGPRFTERRAFAPRDKLTAAEELFAALGHGHLRFDLGPEGGSVHADALHHAAGSLLRHGGRAPTRVPVDTFAAGYCSAAASLAFPSDWGRFEAEEVRCAARGDKTCTFTLTRRAELPRFGVVITRALVEAIDPLPSGSDGWSVPPAAVLAPPAAPLLDTLTADTRGLISACGAYLALVPVSYAAQITFDTLHLIERRSPDLAPVFEALVREAAQLGTFHLVGGLLASPAHGTVTPRSDPRERLDQLLGLCRALGWGALSAAEYLPGRSLTLQCPLTPEGAYYSIRHGATLRRRLLFLQGTALGLMQLLTRVDYLAPEPIRPDTYPALFRSGPRLTVEEVRSPLRGDPVCEVRVDASNE